MHGVQEKIKQHHTKNDLIMFHQHRYQLISYEINFKTLFNVHYMLGGAGNKSYTIWNYTLLILSYHQMQHDKRGWNFVTSIIIMKWLISIEWCCYVLIININSLINAYRIQYTWLFVSQPMNSTHDYELGLENIGDVNIREDPKESDNDVWSTYSLCTIMSQKHRRVNTWLDSWCIWRAPSDDGVDMLSNDFMVIACERTPVIYTCMDQLGSTKRRDVCKLWAALACHKRGKDGFGDATPPYKPKLPSTPHFFNPNYSNLEGSLWVGNWYNWPAMTWRHGIYVIIYSAYHVQIIQN